MHFVGLGLQVLEEALDTVPLLVPLAAPVGRAVDDPVLLLRCELVPGGVAWNAGRLGVTHQVVLAFGPGRGLDRLDGAGAQGELFIRNHQAVIDPDHAAKAAASLAGAYRRVEREHRGNGVGIALVAFGAMQAGGEFPNLGLFLVTQAVNIEAPATAFERDLDGLDDTRALGLTEPKTIRHHIQNLSGAGRGGHFALGLHLGKATG